MYIIDEETGNMTLRQGDSAELTIENIPNDREYSVFFSIYNSKRVIIFELMKTPVDGAVTFEITPELSNLLTVPTEQKTAVYYWAVKRCYKPDNFEDTLIVGDKKISDVNKVTVYPLVAEGEDNES